MTRTITNRMTGATIWTGEAETAWAKGGACPYADVKVQRVANFQERRDCWKPRRKLLTAYQLMVKVLREKCADSDYHDKPKGKK